MDKIEQLKEDNIQIALEIDRAEQLNDYDKQIELKRVFYTNKLSMIDLITQKNEKRSISAKELRSKIKSMKPVTRYETGIKVIDNELTRGQNHSNGFEVGSLIMLAGQSGAGKTHLILEMLSNISKYSKCLFFNFEMGDRRLDYRLSKLLKDDTQLDNFMINSECRTLEDLLMEIRLYAEEGIKFFAIDSRMKIDIAGNGQEYQKISQTSKALSEVAIKNDIILFVINQISEENIKSGWKSFKGSGDQIYNTDMALFLTINEDGSRQLECTKNRQDEKGWNITLPKIIEVVETPYKYSNDSVSMPDTA